MKPICLLLTAALSLPFCAEAATRPHYGGTLRMEVRGVLSSFEIPSTANATREVARDLVLESVCDRLVKLDENGDPRPSLAASWRSERDNRTWYFALRNGVTLHNGTILTTQIAATALGSLNPNWRVRAADREIQIQSDTSVANLLYELAQPRNSVCLAGDRGQWVGSGPFQIGSFQEGQRLDLRAFDDAWEGRPFLDGVHIEMNRSFADQSLDFQLGKADVIETDSAQPRPANSARSSITQPIDLFALVFTPNHPFAADIRVRESIARAIDRASIYSVPLRRQGDPAAALLPEAISGYAHLFNGAQDLAGAKQLRGEIPMLAPLSLSYDGSDDLSKLIAERVAVNAREAGITVQPRPETPAFRGFDADIQLVRVRLETPDRATALGKIGDLLDIKGLQNPGAARSLEELYTIEADALKTYTVIPVAHVPEAFSAGPAVHDWMLTGCGGFQIGNAWLESPR